MFVFPWAGFLPAFFRPHTVWERTNLGSNTLCTGPVPILPAAGLRKQAGTGSHAYPGASPPGRGGTLICIGTSAGLFWKPPAGQLGTGPVHIVMLPTMSFLTGPRMLARSHYLYGQKWARRGTADQRWHQRGHQRGPTKAPRGAPTGGTSGGLLGGN
jgi:hypothetical protein